MATRFVVLSQVGYWNDDHGTNFGDVVFYEAWSGTMVGEGTLPSETPWQYPPGAAYLMLIPRLGLHLGASYGTSFVVEMLLFDLIGLALIILFATREGRDTGVWVWLAAMPFLFALPVLRFDIVPAVIAIAALIALHVRPLWFGALAGLGASIKVWPVAVLFAEWDHRRLVRSAVAAAVALALVFALTEVVLSDSLAFIGHQSGRGLQVESVAAAPWHLWSGITGNPVAVVSRDGSAELDYPLAEHVAKLLDLAAFAAIAAAAAWWLWRDRELRRGRSELADPVLARDFVFALVLLLVVVSRVLSPQFMIWLLALTAVVLSAPRTKLARPAWIVIAAIVLTAGIYSSPYNYFLRNGLLVLASADAAIAMCRAVRPGEANAPRRADAAGVV